jgi:hypothetical protein
MGGHGQEDVAHVGVAVPAGSSDTEHTFVQESRRSIAADNIIKDRMPGLAAMSTIARTARADRHVGERSPRSRTSRAVSRSLGCQRPCVGGCS